MAIKDDLHSAHEKDDERDDENGPKNTADIHEILLLVSNIDWTTLELGCRDASAPNAPRPNAPLVDDAVRGRRQSLGYISAPTHRQIHVARLALRYRVLSGIPQVRGSLGSDVQ
jgi:hypothetical protein